MLLKRRQKVTSLEYQRDLEKTKKKKEYCDGKITQASAFTFPLPTSLSLRLLSIAIILNFSETKSEIFPGIVC